MAAAAVAAGRAAGRVGSYGVIRIVDVTRRYGRGGRAVDALRGVSLDVPRGQTCAIIGPNGAGKSTLFALTLGFLHPTTGEVTIDGLEPRRWVRKQGAGWLPERFTPPADWRVEATLLALARLARVGDARRSAQAALERWGLRAIARRRVATLSRGQLQRLALAQAWCTPHDLVLLDEPTDGLDLDGRAILRETVRERRAAGTTVLLASHDLAEVERLADRVVLIADGTVRETDSSPADSVGFVLHLDVPDDLLRDVFPAAERVSGSTAQPGAGGRGARWAVRVDGVATLNAGLARILEAGGLVLGLAPLEEGLESRVTRALHGQRGSGGATADTTDEGGDT